MAQATGAVPTKIEAGKAGSLNEYESREVVRHLAHELRQPLSTIETIACYFDMVLPRHDVRTRNQVARLQQVVEQAEWILSDAIQFLQASPANPQLIDLDEFISEGVAEVARGEQVWVEVSLSPVPALVRLDPDQARHLLRSLLYFFRQSSKPDPRLLLRTTSGDGEVRLEFGGHGTNHSPEELELMFEPFSPHSPAGSGLALASVRRIVETHGGHIFWADLDSEHPMLVITLPIAS